MREQDQRLPSLPSMLWKAITGVSTIAALLIVMIAPDSVIARFVGGGSVLLAALGVTVYHFGLRAGHRIGLQIASDRSSDTFTG